MKLLASFRLLDLGQSAGLLGRVVSSSQGLYYLPRVNVMMMEKLVEWMILAGETEVLGGNLPLGHFVHHKSHLQTRALTRAPAVGSQQLTASAMARPIWSILSWIFKPRQSNKLRTTLGCVGHDFDHISIIYGGHIFKQICASRTFVNIAVRLTHGAEPYLRNRQLWSSSKISLTCGVQLNWFKVKVTLRLMVSQSVSKSWCLVFIGRPLWREDGCLSYVHVFAAGLCQRSLSRVRVPITVSDLRLPFSSPLNLLPQFSSF
jgi:hypothetical protein